MDLGFARLEALVERYGFSEPLGSQHHALFLGAGLKLLVTFEFVRAARPATIPVASAR
jgi:hypothetical protein